MVPLQFGCSFRCPVFKRSTVFKWVSPNDKLATYGLDDPEVEGVACHFTAPERGGFKEWIGLAEEVSDISLACRQIAPVRFKAKFEQGEDMFKKRRSLFFKKMQIRLRRQAQCFGLHCLFGPHHRWLAKELPFVCAHHAFGQRLQGSAMR